MYRPLAIIRAEGRKEKQGSLKKKRPSAKLNFWFSLFQRDLSVHNNITSNQQPQARSHQSGRSPRLCSLLRRWLGGQTDGQTVSDKELATPPLSRFAFAPKIASPPQHILSVQSQLGAAALLCCHSPLLSPVCVFSRRPPSPRPLCETSTQLNAVSYPKQQCGKRIAKKEWATPHRKWRMSQKILLIQK